MEKHEQKQLKCEIENLMFGFFFWFRSLDEESFFFLIEMQAHRMSNEGANMI